MFLHNLNFKVFKILVTSILLVANSFHLIELEKITILNEIELKVRSD